MHFTYGDSTVVKYNSRNEMHLVLIKIKTIVTDLTCAFSQVNAFFKNNELLIKVYYTYFDQKLSTVIRKPSKYCSRNNPTFFYSYSGIRTHTHAYAKVLQPLR